MRQRVGFIVGKTTDTVDDPKFKGNLGFLKGLPDELRIQGNAHVDVAIAWHIHRHHDEFDVDIITPKQVTLERLSRNLCNFVIGWDLLDALLVGPDRLEEVMEVFKACGNLVPSWEVQEFIYYKTRYMKACMDAGVPTAPTFFLYGGQCSADGCLDLVKARGWTNFVIKKSFMCWSIGFAKFSVDKLDRNSGDLQAYFDQHSQCPEFLVQEAIESFSTHWETRVFWWNGEYVYAVANRAAVSTGGKGEVIITGDDIPHEFLEGAKRVGRQALQVLPKSRNPAGGYHDMPLIRTDIGCSEGVIHDSAFSWNPDEKTFFLNEIEYGGTNYFARHLKFDCIPLWAEKYAAKAREIEWAEHASSGGHIGRPLQPAEDALQTAAHWLSHADALIVGCGSGMGADPAVPEEICKPTWLRMDVHAAWNFWFSCYSRYSCRGPHEGYKTVAAWAKEAPFGAFCLTTAIDGHWTRSGWPEEHMLELRGSIEWLQCSRHDCRDAWPTPENFRLTGDPGTCSRCGGKARPCIRMDLGGDCGFSEAVVRKQRQEYLEWLHRIGEWPRGDDSVSVVLLELGCGRNSQARRELEEILAQEPRSRLIRVNTEDCGVAGSLGGRAIPVRLGAWDALRRMGRLGGKCREASFVCQDTAGNGAEVSAPMDSLLGYVVRKTVREVRETTRLDERDGPVSFSVMNPGNPSEWVELRHCDPVMKALFFTRMSMQGDETPVAAVRITGIQFGARNARLDARSKRVRKLLDDLNWHFGAPEYQSRLHLAGDRLTVIRMIKEVQVTVMQKHGLLGADANTKRIRQMILQIRSFNSIGMQGIPELMQKVDLSMRLSGSYKLDALPLHAKSTA